jgi:hypothetical protein
VWSSPGSFFLATDATAIMYFLRLSLSGSKIPGDCRKSSPGPSFSCPASFLTSGLLDYLFLGSNTVLKSSPGLLFAALVLFCTSGLRSCPPLARVVFVFRMRVHFFFVALHCTVQITSGSFVQAIQFQRPGCTGLLSCGMRQSVPERAVSSLTISSVPVLPYSRPLTVFSSLHFLSTYSRP